MGAAAAAVGWVARLGQPRRADREKRQADDALWLRAASMHAASEARRQARGPGTPMYPPGKREPFRPWFADSADEELWLNAEGTGEPWFTADWT